LLANQYENEVYPVPINFTGFVNTYVSGIEVVSALRKCQKTSEFGVQVITKKNPTGTWYFKKVNITSTGSRPEDGTLFDPVGTTHWATNVHNPTSDEFISPAGKFHSQILKDNSNVIRGIIFSQS